MVRGKFRAEVPRRFGGFFRNDAEHRDFTAIGTAAGALRVPTPSSERCISLQHACNAYSRYNADAMLW